MFFRVARKMKKTYSRLQGKAGFPRMLTSNRKQNPPGGLEARGSEEKLEETTGRKAGSIKMVHKGPKRIVPK